MAITKIAAGIFEEGKEVFNNNPGKPKNHKSPFNRKEFWDKAKRSKARAAKSVGVGVAAYGTYEAFKNIRKNKNEDKGNNKMAITKTGQLVKEAYVGGSNPEDALKTLKYYSHDDQLGQLQKAYQAKAEEPSTRWGKALGVGAGVGATVGSLGAGTIAGGGLRNRLFAAGIGALSGGGIGATVGGLLKSNDDHNISNAQEASETLGRGGPDANEFRVNSLQKADTLQRQREMRENQAQLQAGLRADRYMYDRDRNQY